MNAAPSKSSSGANRDAADIRGHALSHGDRGVPGPAPSAKRQGHSASLACGCARPRGCSPGCPSGRKAAGLAAARRGSRDTPPFRPFHKPGAGCAAYPRCWRSRRTAISASYPIEHTPTSGCICSSTPTTDARTIPTGLPSPARAVVLARADAALPELVRTRSGVGVDEGGCSPTRAGARCACRSSWIRPAASTPATPAIAAKEGSRRNRSQRRTVEGVEMRIFGDEQDACSRGSRVLLSCHRGTAPLTKTTQSGNARPRRCGGVSDEAVRGPRR